MNIEAELNDMRMQILESNPNNLSIKPVSFGNISDNPNSNALPQAPTMPNILTEANNTSLNIKKEIKDNLQEIVDTHEVEVEQMREKLNNMEVKDIVEISSFRFGVDQDFLSSKRHETIDVEDAVRKAQETYSHPTLTFDIWKRNIDLYLLNTSRRTHPYIPSHEQYRALLSYTDRQSIEAGPGTGKTTTMTHKILIDNILSGYGMTDQMVLTYSNKSAEDMRARYLNAARSVNQTVGALFGTIHAIAKMIADILNPNLTVLTDVKVKKYIKDTTITTNEDDEEEEYTAMFEDIDEWVEDDDEDDELREAYIERTFDTLSVIKEAMDLTGLTHKYLDKIVEVKSYLSMIVEKDINTEQRFKGIPEVADNPDIKYSEIMKIYHSAKNLRMTYELIDFTDMLLDTYKYLRSLKTIEDINDPVLKSIVSKKAIYVDELQDISPLQMKIINEFLRLNPNCRLFCIGDIDQSIYGFRGAEPRYLLSFNKLEFNAGKSLETSYFTLNRRSGEGIVRLSDRLITNNKIRYQKVMKSANDIQTDIQIKRMSLQDAYRDIFLDVQRIYEEEETGRNIAILARENSLIMPLSIMLLHNGIKINTKDALLPTNIREVKDIIAIIQFLDEITVPFKVEANLHKIFRSITRSDAKIVAEEVRKSGKPFSTFLEKEKLILEDLNEYRQLYRDVRDNKVMKEIFARVIMLYQRAYLSKLKKDKEGLNNAIMFLKAYENLSYRDFMKTWFRLLEDMKPGGTSARSNLGVTQITEHTSKGLEFDYVFILGVGDKYSPKRSIIERLPEKAIPMYIEEERRLLYVAMTRAKKYLRIYFDEKPGIFYKELGGV